MTQWIVSSCVLILVIIALRFVLRGRVKPMVQYALWALVLVRLLVPVSLGSTAISVQNAAENIPVVQQMEMAEQVKHFVYHIDGTATGYSEFTPVLDHTPLQPVSKPVPQTFTTRQAQQITNLWSVGRILRQIWFVGMAVTGLVFLLSNLRFALRLRKSRKFAERNTLPVYVTGAVDTPCLFGLFRPAIYLPPEVAEEERHRMYSVAHELTHYRHGDALWSVLRCVCIVVHWYNPLVWWAAILSREDCEMACDEATIAQLGEAHRGDYGRVLVDLTCRKRTDLLQTATTMTGSAKGLKKRISIIVKKPKMAIYTLIAVILVSAVAVGCTFTDGKKEDKPADPDTSSTSDTSEDEEDDQIEDTTEKLPEEIVGTPLTEHELKQFTAMFTIIPEGTNWYNILLSCNFFRPEEVDVRILFGNGFRNPALVELTDADVTFLQTHTDWYIPNAGDVYKLPVSRMEEVLNTYLGISVQTVNKAYLDRMTYFADADSYFVCSVGAGALNFEMIDGKRESDGTVWLLCRSQTKAYTTYKTDWLRILCLKPRSGKDTVPYRVHSCVWVEYLGKPYTGSVNSDDYIPFLYTGRSIFVDGKEVELPSVLEQNTLYSYRKGEYGGVNQVSYVPVPCYDISEEYIYYAVQDSSQVIRCNYAGGQTQVVYTTKNKVTWIRYAGNNELLVVEDGKRAILYKMETGEATVLTEQYSIEEATYYGDTTTGFPRKDKGPTLVWTGKVSQDAEMEMYFYYINSKELVVAYYGHE